MTAQQWLIVILLGGLMGLIGQGIRVVVGLKKAKDAAASHGRAFADEFESSRLLISLLIGAIAGAFAALLTLRDGNNISADALIAVAGAGYSGADFLEGMMAKYLVGTDAGERPAPPAGPSSFAPPGRPPSPQRTQAPAYTNQPPAEVRPLPRAG
jgi:hypothetical protein